MWWSVTSTEGGSLANCEYLKLLHAWMTTVLWKISIINIMLSLINFHISIFPYCVFVCDLKELIMMHCIYSIVTTLNLLARQIGCYKLGLDCKDNMKPFYSSLGFTSEEGNANTMIIRFPAAPPTSCSSNGSPSPPLAISSNLWEWEGSEKVHDYFKSQIIQISKVSGKKLKNWK